MIGGGSSGMVAAITAARAGAGVVLLERMNRVGKKLLATGNGRCNLTNADCQLAHFHGGDRSVVAAVLAQFPVADTLQFFERLGIAWKTEEDGKIYPYSDQASAVLDVLRYELEQVNVEILVDADVVAVRPEGSRFALELQDRRQVSASRVVLATGGRAGPQFGSNGSGYRLAESLGHRVIEPAPRHRVAANRRAVPARPERRQVRRGGGGEIGPRRAASGSGRSPVHRLRHLGAAGAAGQPDGPGGDEEEDAA